MKKFIITERKFIEPYSEPASALPIMNRPLREHQQEVLFGVLGPTDDYAVDSMRELEGQEGELIVYRDNLYFDENLLSAFLDSARKRNGPCQIAFASNDASITEHAFQLQRGIKAENGFYLADLYYYPQGHSKAERPKPVVVDTESEELWYLAVPTKDHNLKKGLVLGYQIPERIRFSPIRLFVPLKPFVSIESWVHLLFANFIWGIHSRSRRLHKRILEDPAFRRELDRQARLEGKPPLQCSALVKVGRDCEIDPSAVLLGPTTIGDRVVIGPGTTIAASIIGDEVTIGQGCQIWLSVIGSGCTLPFKAATLMSCLMQNCIVNTTVRLSIIGNNSFVGDGVWFTDRNLVGRREMDQRLGGEIVRTVHEGRLVRTGYFVLGSAIGHDVKVATGHIIYPGRVIASGNILTLSSGEKGFSRVIRRDVV